MGIENMCVVATMPECEKIVSLQSQALITNCDEQAWHEADPIHGDRLLEEFSLE